MNVSINLEKSQVFESYRQMMLIRLFEETSGRLYMQGKIRGFMHSYIGQEAVAVGSIPILNDEDYVITHYRDHGHALTRGMEPKKVMAELYGKVTGTSGGRGGSMHLFDATRNFMGGYAIVGGQLPIAVGLALAIKYRSQDNVALCFLGDGAINQGEFHESMNLASLWGLPVLFILENNLYGMGSHIKQTHAGGKDLYHMAEAYKIPAAQIDGMNLLDVRNATIDSLKRIRSGSGPVFLEAMTYRFQGHSLSDPSVYRERAEVEKWKLKDPIERFKLLALKEKLITAEEISLIDDEVRNTVEESVHFAEESPSPDPDSILDDVYS